MSSTAPVAIIIDDERDIRGMIKAVLQHEGWTVREASNGREGLELVKDALPQLVIVDLMMSGMSGLEFCHKLTALPGGGNVAVLLISGINEKAQLLQDFWQLPLRHKNFLRKPFGVTELLQTVQGMLPKFQSSAPKPLLTPTPSTPVKPASPPSVPVSATSRPPEMPSWMQGVQLTQVESGSTFPPQQQPTASAPPRFGQQPPSELKPITSQKPSEEHKKGYRILVVDDEPDIRMILDTALSMFHTVAQAENGMEALKVMDSFYPDFVLSDINMPVMNGLETAEAIRRHPVLCRIPIFFLTAEQGADMPKRTYDVGGNLFLRKPVDPFRLINYIDFFLNETGLEPESYWKQRQAGGAGGAGAAPKPQAAPGAIPIRILTVDFNIENQKLLKRIFGEASEPATVPGGPFETLWTEDPRTALGNLARWQPDLVLYNPRNPGFDGVAFGQTLKLQKIMDQTMVLIGPRFYEADLSYADRVLKTPVIDISGTEPAIARKLGEVIQRLRPQVKPKQFGIAELLKAEGARQKELQSANARTARERETFRQRFTKVQEFIDQQYGS